MKTQISAYFNDFNAGAKKDVIKLEIRGELTDEQIVKLHKLKGNSVVVTLASGQLELDDYEDHEDGDYPHSQFMHDKPNEEGQQLSIDDVKNDEASSEKAGSEPDAAEADESKEIDSVPGDEGQQPEEGEPEAEPEKEQQQEPDKEPETETEKVADINKARTRRGRKKKEDQDKTEEQPAPESSGEDELPPLASDDDLPF